MRTRSLLPIFAALGVAFTSAQAASETSTLAGRHSARERLITAPLRFEPNVGQSDERAHFIGRGAGYTAFVVDGGVVLSLGRTAAPVTIQFGQDAAPGAPHGEERLPGVVHYYRGADPADWHTNVPTYAQVRQEGVYPGIDAVFYGRGRRLEFDFVVAPGSDPNHIRFELQGAKSLSIDESGDIVVETSAGNLIQKAPVAHQELVGERRRVEARYEFLADNRIGFVVGDYDPGRELVIDPVLEYAAALGSGQPDDVRDLAVDADGAAYIVGGTNGTDFPFTTGTPQSNSFPMFLTKIAPDGLTLEYSVFVQRGSVGARITALGLALDAEKNAYVVGETVGVVPHTAGAFDTICDSCLDPTRSAGFLLKFDAAGALSYGTYLEGDDLSHNDASDVALDEAGDAYIVGTTREGRPDLDNNPNFPVSTGAFQETYGGDFDLFVFRLRPEGQGADDRIYATYLGGSGSEFADGIAPSVSLQPDCTSDCSAYVGATTRSTDFPLTADALDSTLTVRSAAVSKLSSDGSALEYSTLVIRAADSSTLFDLDVDASGSVYATGWRTAVTTTGTRAFAFKLDATGSRELYATQLSDVEQGTGIAVDALGNAHVVGTTFDPDFVEVDPIQANNASHTNRELFVVTLDPTGSTRLFATTYGGAGAELRDLGGIPVIVLHRDGSLDTLSRYVAGRTQSADFPVTPFDCPSAEPAGVYDGCVEPNSFSGVVDDVYILKIGPDNTAPTAMATATPNPVECGAAVTLDGSSSFDLNNDPLTFEWTGFPGGPLSGESVDVTLPFGDHEVTLTVTDPAGASSSTQVTVTVLDTTPPGLTLQNQQVTVEIAASQTTATVDVLAASGASGADLCNPSVQLTFVPNQTEFPEGDTTVTITAVDTSGNVTNSLFLVTVDRLAAPDPQTLHLMLDARGSFLQSNSPVEPVIVDLAAGGYAPGDEIEISYDTPAPGYSFFSCDGPFVTLNPFNGSSPVGDGGASLRAVFASSDALLGQAEANRVSDAIDVGFDDPSSPDIPEDFNLGLDAHAPDRFRIAVPPGATHLFLGIGDSIGKSDNCAPGNRSSEFPQGAIEITIKPFPPQTLDLMLDARGSFLQSNSPVEPVIVDLAAGGDAPGDEIEISYDTPAPGYSFFSCNGPFVTLNPFNASSPVGDGGASLRAVFASSSVLLEQAEAHRVPDAIDVGFDDPSSPDIPEDFNLGLDAHQPDRFRIAVPPGATHLFLGIGDSLVKSDNCAPGNQSSEFPQGAIEVTIRPFLPQTDTDGDGIPDEEDPCPSDDANACAGAGDVDGDGIPNAFDDDDDGDGASDAADPCPLDPADRCLFDPDDDGIPNPQDACPTDVTNQCADDADGDGTPNISDTDADDDGFDNDIDPCPYDDTDSCGVIDADGDGQTDFRDPCPDDATDQCNQPGPPGTIRTVAGGGLEEGRSALASSLHGPFHSATDSGGNLYIADAGTHRIRRVGAVTGLVTTVAGTGSAGFNGDDIPGEQAQLNIPRGVAVDAVGNLYIADAGNDRVRRVDPVTGLITTVAGTGSGGFNGDGIPADQAQVVFPAGVSVDDAGNLYIADNGNHRVRRVDGSTRLITSIAGTGSFGFNGDDIPAEQAQLKFPTSVAVDGAGNLYIADSNNRRVRRVDAETGLIETVAGTGSAGFNGDDIPADEAQLGLPVGVSVDNAGNLYIGDSGDQRVRRVDSFTGLITTVAGTGVGGFNGDHIDAAQAQLSFPNGVAVDAAGNLYIADSGNQRVRRVAASTSLITSAAGTGSFGFNRDDIPARQAQLRLPRAVAVDFSGNLYVAESNDHRIRRINADTGLLATVAGTGFASFNGDDVPAEQASLNHPRGVAIDDANNLYIADASNHRIRRVDADTGLITTVVGTGSAGFNDDGIPARNAHLNLPLDVAVDEAGNLYIADSNNRRVRRVDIETGLISTVAGTGSVGFNGDDIPANQAQMGPIGVSVDDVGNLYIVDAGNQRIRRVDSVTGLIETVAGTGDLGFTGDDIPAQQAVLNLPTKLAVDSVGNVYIADSNNQRIRRVDVATNLIKTVAGTGESSFNGDDIPAAQASLWSPSDVAVDAAGNLFIADTGNHRIRRIEALDTDGDGQTDVTDRCPNDPADACLNQPPTATDLNLTIDEDVTISVLLLGNDPDGDPLTFSVTAPANGTLDTSTLPTVKYTSNLNYNGPDSFTYTVNDGELTSDPATVSIVVNPVNDPPTVAAPISFATNEDTLLNFQVEAADPEGGGTIGFVIASQPSNGLLTRGPLGNAGQQAAQALTYSPNPNYNGPDSFDLTLTDGEFDVPVTVSITVNPVNDPPTLDPVASAVVDEGATLAFVASASDVDGPSLTFSAPSGLPAGAILDAASGAFSYTPGFDVATNDLPTTAFTVTLDVSDGEFSAQQSFQITVNNVSTGTPPGEDVIVEPIDPNTGTTPVSLGFEDVDSGGSTTVETQQQGPPPPDGFRIGNNTYFNIETDAVFNGLVQVCFDYSAFTVNENKLGLRHFVPLGGGLTAGGVCDSSNPDFTSPAQGCWEPITQESPIPLDEGFQNEGRPNPDVDNDVICGLTASLSPFLLVETLEIAGPVDPVSIGTEVNLSVDLSGSETVDSAVWDWGDGTTDTLPVADPAGLETAAHTYTEAGVYTVNLELRNDGVGEPLGSAEFRFVVVFDSEGGFVTGGGWIDSPPGALRDLPLAAGKATFGFVSKYQRGANVPTGNTQFQFKAGDFRFKSTEYQWLVIAGSNAKYKGSGEVNGEFGSLGVNGYGFMLTATDGGAKQNGDGVDKFRLKIWDKDDGDRIVYDNVLDGETAEDLTGANPQEIGGGSIVIHDR